jgi:uncharacterized repeat protein (TIGR01451 family)
MANYNPNSIWTSKQKEYGPLPESKGTPIASVEFSDAAKKGNVGASHHGKGGGHGMLWFFVVCAAFVAGAAFYFFFLRPTPGLNVSISFVKPDQVFIGDPFELSVSISNNSEAVLKNATLELMLPDGFSFVGQSLDQRMMPQGNGDLSSGSVTNYDFHLIATGNQNSVGHITAKLVYGTDTTNTQFENDSAADVVTGAPAIGLHFTIPQNVFTGQSFGVAVNYHNNTSDGIKNVVLHVQYPPAFVFSTSSVAPVPANGGLWNLGTIAANADGSITITGTVSGSANVAYPFTGNVTSTVSGTDYSLDTQTVNTVIAASPLTLSIALNNTGNTSTSIVNTGNPLDYVLSYANDSSMALQNIVIQATITGGMYDFPLLRSDGAFNSVLNTVTWSTATNPELASLAPGQSGSVEITLGVKKSFPAKGKNYVLKVQAQIQSPTIPPNTSASSTIASSLLASDVSGEIAVAATGYRRDTSGITNAGPYPPAVNQPSQYTIHWDVTNYSTEVRNVAVSAYLQSGSVFTGQVKSNTSTQPTYDAATGLVTWNIPSLPAGTSTEAIFQVTNTPAVNQKGQVVTLMNQTNISADDTFTNSTLRASADPVTTYLPKDPTITNQSGQVAQ